jgi:hypothetical protein
MSAPHPVYRSLVRLYPRNFRGHYGDDLVQHFADLVTDRGARAAWTRTGVDVIVTLPRYRLESIMTEQRSATTLNVAITLLAAGGGLSVLTGIYPGVVLLVAALALAVAQRSTLARAIRTPDSNRRRRRLGIAAVLGLVFLASIVSYGQALSGDNISGASLLVHNAIGVPAMVGAIVFLIVGLLTPRTSDNGRVTPVA